MIEKTGKRTTNLVEYIFYSLDYNRRKKKKKIQYRPYFFSSHYYAVHISCVICDKCISPIRGKQKRIKIFNDWSKNILVLFLTSYCNIPTHVVFQQQHKTKTSKTCIHIHISVDASSFSFCLVYIEGRISSSCYVYHHIDSKQNPFISFSGRLAILICVTKKDFFSP